MKEKENIKGKETQRKERHEGKKDIKRRYERETRKGDTKGKKT